jgi:7-cyano-7-deazaguanine reductase
MDNTQKILNEIVSKHLGKAGDGTIVKPYVTPTEIDKSLLVAVPRKLNRVQYNIDDNNLSFVGVDVWNAYEFSALTDNGFPAVGHVKCVYAASSENIVESKSFKLYLNSFNMCKLGVTPDDVLNTATEIIQRDLREILGDSVQVDIFIGEIAQAPVRGAFQNIDSTPRYDQVTVYNTYNENPNLLVSRVTTYEKTYAVHSSVLRSNCRVTNQPDWGDVYIVMKTSHDIPETSFLSYLISMRNENHFHEEICECIYTRLTEKFNPTQLLVACLYTRRGGIDINPIRASENSLIHTWVPELSDAHTYTQKTWRQ